MRHFPDIETVPSSYQEIKNGVTYQYPSTRSLKRKIPGRTWVRTKELGIKRRSSVHMPYNLGGGVVILYEFIGVVAPNGSVPARSSFN